MNSDNKPQKMRLIKRYIARNDVKRLKVYADDWMEFKS